MKKEIIIPRMGESITSATIGQIFKPSGSLVKQDDEILELETDKVNQVLYAPASGVVQLSVKGGDNVTIDQVIGSVDSEGVATETEKPPEKESKPVEETLTSEEKKGDKPQSEPQAPKQETTVQPEKTTPHESRESKEDFLAGLDVQEPQFSSSMPLKEKEVAHEGESRVKMSRIRQTIARRLVQAKTETAMLTTFNEVDLTDIIALRDKYKDAFQKKYGVKMGFMPFFVIAAVSALKQFPLLNSSIEGDEIVSRGGVDMGVAVSTDRGLVVPVIKNAGALSFAEIETEMAELAKKARDGKLSMDDISGGSFTITNGGAFGSLFSTPILNFPQSGILGMHGIQKRPVVIGDEIKIRSMMYLALSYDHRLVDGKEAVLFLMHIKGLLEEPGRFLVGI